VKRTIAPQIQLYSLATTEKSFLNTRSDCIVIRVSGCLSLTLYSLLHVLVSEILRDIFMILRISKRSSNL